MHVVLATLVIVGMVATALVSRADQWHPISLLVILFVLAVYAKFLRIEVQRNMVFAADFLAVLIAAVLLGPAPAAVMGFLLVLIGELRGPLKSLGARLNETDEVSSRARPILLKRVISLLRPEPSKSVSRDIASDAKETDARGAKDKTPDHPASLDILMDFAEMILEPLIVGILFHHFVATWGITYLDPAYYGLFIAAFMLMLSLNLVANDVFDTLVERYEFGSSLRVETFLIPVEIVAAILAMMVLFAYNKFGEVSVALLGIAMAVVLFYYWHAQNKKVRIEREAFYRLTTRVQALHARDNRTGTHCAAVALYTYEIACAAGLSTKQRFRGYRAGLVHDVGKTGWPAPLLDGSKGRDEITEIDRLHIKGHPVAGADRILGAGFKELAGIIRCHHENLDGSGYPRGFQGHEISEIAKVIRVADTYDVITARDTYQSRRSREEAIAELRSKPDHFEQHYVEALVKALEKDPELNYRHEDRRTYEEAIDFYTVGLLRKKRPQEQDRTVEFPHGAAEPTGREPVVKGPRGDAKTSRQLSGGK